MGIFGTNLNDIEKAIRAWRPRGAKKESDYRNSLVKALQKKFPKADVIKDYGKGRLRTDLFMKFGSLGERIWSGQTECYIEMKNKLITRPEFQRLTGQIEQYIKAEALPMIVVICGKTEKSSLRELGDFIKAKNADLEDDEEISLIAK